MLIILLGIWWFEYSCNQSSKQAVTSNMTGFVLTRSAMQDRPEPLIYDPPMRPYLDVIHRDDDILVLNKQSGLLSVPGKHCAHKDCLEKRAQSVFPTATTVHRLDKDTSGVMIMAMTRPAHRHLGLQFERRKTEKIYIARVWGQVTEEHGEIDLPLICDWPNRPRQMVDHQRGKSAQTRWEVIEREETCTRVILYPHTGRSHQLRVHLLTIGHPILGDNLYGGQQSRQAASRLQLHARKLSLHHPATGQRISFTSAEEF